MKNFLKSLTNLINFFKIKPENRKIVFYSENENFYPFFSSIINCLENEFSQNVCYVTSSITDPILNKKNSKIIPFYIGNETIRTIFFRLFNSSIMILTMPDLNTFHIKRSPYKVNYIYITHNIFSLHMVFRKKAFNHYDTFFCVGPHHNAEIEETEKIYKLKKITKYNFGYDKIDQLLKNRNKFITNINNHDKTVLIAPSWGKNCIIEKIGEQLLSFIVNRGWKIIIRPHPDTLRLYNSRYKKLKDKFLNHSDCKFEENISNMDSFYSSNLMISDWSGAAFEFAFGLEKPVVFIDMPRKINNSDFDLYKIEPIEIKLREKIGELVSIERLDNLINVLDQVYKNNEKYKHKIINERKKTIYNIGKSATNGAKYLYDLINQ